ncbi:MAG TPA: hypothetical protein VFP59_14330 [Candidatus Angelobacter sp.]|nr:hypothetical protein [Candidatus Angelobacter sp.]
MKASNIMIVAIGLITGSFYTAAQIAPTGAGMKALDFKSRGVTLTVPSDPEFEQRVEQGLQENSRSDAVHAVKGISALLRNTTNKAIIGYALRWRFTYPDGTSTLRRVTYVQPGALLDDGHTKHPSSVATSTVIAPGESRLISEVASLGAHSHTNLAGDLRVLQHVDEINALANRSSEVTVMVDAVLFDDGSFIGPDETHFIKNFVASFDALQDFYRDLVALNDSGKAEREIMEWVSKQNTGNTYPLSQSEFERAVAANEFVAVAQQYGFSSAIRLARSKIFVRHPNFVSNQ